MSSHPNARGLRRWLDGEASDRIARHVDQCPVCAERLDDVVDTPELDLGPHLDAILEPPQDLEVRVSQGVARRLEREINLQTYLDLMSLGWQTGRFLMDGTSDEAAPRRPQEGEDDDGR